MEIVLKWLTVIAWCAFKYVFGIITALLLGLSFLETLITTVVGGMIGVFIYLYLWELIVGVWQKYFPPKPKHGIKISNKRRMMVNLINKYEIYGVALLTPILLSVPVGVIISAMLEKNKWKIKLVMLASFVFWTLTCWALYRILDIDITKLLK
jgi:hypothetical protein